MEPEQYSDLNSAVPACITIETCFNVTFLLIRLVTSLAIKTCHLQSLSSSHVTSRTTIVTLVPTTVLVDVRRNTFQFCNY